MIEHLVERPGGDRLWAASTEPPASDATPLLLVMGANAPSATWPPDLVDRLASRHRVVVYDHRDTGRSTWAFDERPYAIRDLAADAIAVLDALDIDRAHVVGMSMGGVLVQLLLLDHPERLLSATVFCTAALGVGLAAGEGEADVELPGPDPRLLALWETMGDERTPEEELAWRVEHWRILNGDEVPFDPEEFAALERRVIDHTGRPESGTAHARADQGGLERGAELAAATVATLVVEAPADPINPPPHAEHLARTIGGARLMTVPGMGHALPAAVVEPLAEAILAHTASVDAGGANAS